jgi:HTH-type transcriptional regulator/antitoxin HipB
MRTPCEVLGELVRVSRRRRKLTQGELAKLAGVGTAFLYQLETGKPTVRMDKVLAVLEALDLCFSVEKADGDRPIRTRLTPWD